MRITAEWIILFFCIAAVANDNIWTTGSIQFFGNNEFSRNDLLNQMQLQPPGLFKKTAYSYTKLIDDIDALENLYRTNGFRNASVKIDRIYRNNEFEIVDIYIRITEGVQNVIDRIVFFDNQVFREKDLLKMLPYGTGTPFDSVVIENSIQIITDNLRAKGFLFSSVSYEIHLDSLRPNVDVYYKIMEGPLVKAGQLQISGNNKVKKQVIEGKVKDKSGKILTSTEITRTTGSLYNTGLFNMVNIQPADTPANLRDLDTVILPVKVNISETEMFQIQTGGGYSTEDGLYGDLSISYRNLFGLGHSISLIGRGSFDILSSELHYAYPSIFGLPVYTDLSGYLKRLEEPTFSGAFGGGILSINGLIGRFSHYRGYLQAEKVSWINEPSIDTTEGAPANLFIIGAGITRDTRRSVFNPGKAFFGFIDLEFAGLGIIPWSSNFSKIRGDLRIYLPFSPKKITWSSAISGGYISGYSSDPVPAQQQFFFGSDNIRLIRGYSEKELTIYNENGNALGGNFFLVFTPVEIVYPIFSILNGALFLEGGNVWPEISTFRFGDFNWAAGPGIRIATPIGPIRLDYGVKLDGELPLDGRFSLGIGLPF